MTLETAAETFIQSIPYGLLVVLLFGLLGSMVFLMSPFSVVLNVITVPLGYEFQSCPFCPAFGIEKITHTECAACGTEITENFSSGISPSGEGEMYHFCERGCQSQWRESRDSA